MLEAGEEGQKPCEKGSFAVEKGKGLAAGGAFGRIPPPFLFFHKLCHDGDKLCEVLCPVFFILILSTYMHKHRLPDGSF